MSCGTETNLEIQSFYEHSNSETITSKLNSPLHIQEASRCVRSRWNRVSDLIYQAGCASQSLLLSKSDKCCVNLSFLLLMKGFLQSDLTHSTATKFETLGSKLCVFHTFLTYQELPCGEVTVNKYLSIKKWEKRSVKTQKNRLLSTFCIREK